MGKGVFDVTLVFGTLSSYAIWVNGQAGKAMSVTFSFVFCIFLGGGGCSVEGGFWVFVLRNGEWGKGDGS